MICQTFTGEIVALSSLRPQDGRKGHVIRVPELIERKRNGGELSDEEISELVLGFTRGDVPDYQMSAWCMAVYFRGLNGRETHALTDAMIRSGDTIDLGAAVGRRIVDKHSTGGVGDKTSIAVGPIVAACGVPFGKMSGRGLAHSGGTLDKLESIPGFRVELSIDEFVSQVRDVGLAIVGQTSDLVPADKKIYALRDVTATVDINPLIASSIMSKKIATGADAIVLDVKVGDGAHGKRTLDDARILAEQMLDLGRRAGREAVCLLTDMDQPLGAAVGNALEIREAVDTIVGEGPPDFTELVLDVCARLLALSDLGVDVDEGRRLAERSTADGSAREAYERWIRAQGGNPDLDALPRAPVIREVVSPRDGMVTRLAALPIGIAALELGGGRRTKDDEIDHAVGIVCSAKRGQTVEEGQVLADVHARDEESAARAAEAVLGAYEIGGAGPSRPRGILLEVVG
jgi:pyrimidine-nucleoside phosphorylase